MLGYNVHFVKCPELRLAKVVTLRPIIPGEELFANYGTILFLGLVDLLRRHYIYLSVPHLNVS